jgi:hypothetical protein
MIGSYPWIPVTKLIFTTLQGKASGLFNLGSYDDAIAVYDKILSIVPNMVNANISKGDALF